jgi:hypothetical protein
MEYKKDCLSCGKTFNKPYSCSKKNFEVRTKYCSMACKNVKGERNGCWKGDNIQKDSIHCWVAREWGIPKKCELCGTENSPKFEWSKKNHTYKRDRGDWQRVCKKCHLEYDIKFNNYIHHIPTRYAKNTQTNH